MSQPVSVFVVFCCLHISLVSVTVSALPHAPRHIPPVNPDDPARLPKGITKRVLVAGGGLAGLSAALELAERGYKVTIRESSDRIGGKLFSRPVLKLNRTFSVEHGFHAWFNNYHNFKDIRQRLDIDSNFKPWGAVDYIFKKYKPERLYSKGPYPLNLLGIIYRSPNMNLTGPLKSLKGIPDMLWFDYNTVYDKYDEMTFREWATFRNIDKTFYDIIMQPSLSVTLNERETISAAEMLMYMQMYFLSDAKADHREVATKNYHQAVIKPWLKKLRSYGVKIQKSTPIKSFTFNVTTGLITGDSKHGKDQFDYVVMATDLIGVHNIFKATLQRYKSQPWVSKKLRKMVGKISGLRLAPPYKVLRVWFDKQIEGASMILQTPDYTPVNLIAQYHLLEDEYAQWAEDTGGSVMEFHLYTWKYGDVPDDEVWDLIVPTVKQIYPEIFERNFTILAHHVNSFQNFPSFEKGSHKYRPTSTFAVECGIENLMLAGDWLHTLYPSALMERAVSTGREAANQILLTDHVRQATLIVTSSYGPGLFL